MVNEQQPLLPTKEGNGDVDGHPPPVLADHRTKKAVLSAVGLGAVALCVLALPQRQDSAPHLQQHASEGRSYEHFTAVPSNDLSLSAELEVISDVRTVYLDVDPNRNEHS
jgi:hypothetical protein